MHHRENAHRTIAEALARELPETAHLQAIRDACSAISPSSSAYSLEKVLETSAFLLLCPEQTVQVARAMGPFLLECVARALSAARAAAPGSLHPTVAAPESNATAKENPIVAAVSPAERAEDVLVAMSRLLPVAPHALPLALQHWRSSPCPFDCITTLTAAAAAASSSPGISGEEDETAASVLLQKRVHKVAEAAHKLLSCAALSRSIAALWNWSPFFGLCRHPDALVRWHAVGVCSSSSLLGLDEQGRRRLLKAARALDGGPPSSQDSTRPCQNQEQQIRKTPQGGAAAAESTATTGSGTPAAVVPDSNDAEAISKARLDLLDDLRRAPSALVPPPPPPVRERQEEPSRSAAAAARFTFRHHPSVADIGGILHAKTAPPSSSYSSSREHDRRHGKGGEVPMLVPTASARRNLSSLSLALTVDRPILLYGPAGSGKSLLAREAARLISNSGDGVDPEPGASSTPLLELHLDDQTDSKSLLGAHACTDVPGEFAWRPGALTRAAAAGTWVLIEDLDRAPFEVLAAIGPLLEGRPLTLPGRTRPLIAAPGFRVFGTVTPVGAGGVVLGGAADFGALWTHVPVEPLSVSETLRVAKARYPGLPPPALKRMLSTMVAAKSGNSGGGGFGLASRSAAGREPGVRDFLKLCTRVDTLGVFDRQNEDEVSMSNECGPQENDQEEDDDHLNDEDGWFCSEAQALPVVVESLDVFAGHLTTKEARAHAAEVVAGLWNVLPSRAVEIATTSRPEFVQAGDYLKIGRVTLPKLPQAKGGVTASSSFAPTSHALRLMETLAASAQACEPVLLVGETGCGKTALVQRLAEGTGRDLVVQNLSLQTDGADLLGGFRPVELRQLAEEVLREFLRLFPLLFSATQNARFCQAITSSFERRQWSRLSKGLRNAAKMAMDKLDRSRSEALVEATGSDARNQQHKSIKVPRAGSAGGSTSPSGQRRDWERFHSNAERFERQRAAVEGSFAFSFVEGVLVKAIREGKWVLLDEINLASAETLQRLSGLLEGAEGSLCLTERGDMNPVVRHKDFRLFAAMNPPTDASKKDLPPALRRRFSEVYVPELDDRVDLKQVVDGYISDGVSVDHDGLAFTAVDLYLWARGLSTESLSDGAGQRPRYSLRTLVGAVSCARRLVDRGFSAKRAMVEGYRSLFETQLDGDGRAKILKGILRAFGKGMSAKDLEKPPRRPGGRASSSAPWVRIGPFWLEGGPHDPVDAAELDPTTNQRRFVLTASVGGTLRCLARAVASSDSPVLLQGPTSAGKTSIVEYLAARLGHRCVRINNHEHTDIQEYTGSYAADGNGKLAFQEGVLVESLRKGYWIILDELNLAPSEVLEALNRLLDHNRELYLSETQETIKPHPNFRLFATQNPPGAYGGRKPLSRAFRNRFMEVHVDDIPGAEWEIILAERCGLPPSHCKLLVKVLHELQAQRQSSRLFLGKHGAISPRDLLRWAGRKPQGKQQLAEEGYMLLAERLRSAEEKAAMRAVLEEQIGVPLDPDCLYGTSPPPSQKHAGEAIAVNAMETGEDFSLVDESDLGGFSQLAVIEPMLDRGEGLEAGLQRVAMTRHMRRLFRLSGRCLSHIEPLLLVGATGCGKTTVCQLYSMLLQRRMHVVNCHQNTEAADLLGGLRPLRGRDVLVEELRDRAKVFVERCTKAGHEGGDGMEWTGDNLDVVGLMAAVQAAWAKLRQKQSSRGVGGDGDVNGAKVSAEAYRRKQKRAYPEPDSPECAVSGKHGFVGASNENDHRPDVVSVKARAVAEPSTGGRRRKSGGAKRRKAAADESSRLQGASDDHERPPPPAAADRKDTVVGPNPTPGESTGLEEQYALEREFVSLKALAVRTKGLFEWVDGPLVTAMRKGELILLDELSLAEDAVLERLNSVLEPGRSITLAEKGGKGAVGGEGAAEAVVAAPGFRVMATMNPGGDFGKRELSPALRSRFTEVWVPALSDREDMEGVVQKAFRFGNNNSMASTDLTRMAGPMLDFAWWFNSTASSSLGGGHGLSLSVRDLLSWAGFITSSVTSSSPDSRSSEPGLRPWEAYVHGSALILLDGMGLGAGLSPSSVVRLRQACVKFLKGQIPSCPEQTSALGQLDRDGGERPDKLTSLAFEVRELTSVKMEDAAEETTGTPRFVFGVEPFFTPCGPAKVLGSESANLDFSVEAPTTSKNLRRVLRALQIRKAVLLEGSPGVGKTSLISALAAATGHELVRINLSEQTDVSDLFGSDLPVPDTDSGEQTGQPTEGSAGNNARFSWCDGVFLSALKAGRWVLLDELNLATQSVLEGLNACLDHRAEVYIPELGRSFKCPPTFKVFAAQNPLGQGGGRKGLPRSFLSRFTKVYVDPLTPDDLLYIAVNKFPSLAAPPSPSSSPVSSDAALIAATDGNSQDNEKSSCIPCDAASMLSRMIAFNSLVQEDTMAAGRYGRRGSPWEFNLRDVFRWCELMLREQQHSGSESDAGGGWEPWLVVDTLYIQRLRTRSDRAAVLDRFRETFPESFLENSSPSSAVGTESCSGWREGGIGTHPVLKVTPEWMQVGQTVLPRGCWGNGTSASDGDADGLRAGITIPLALRRPLQALARCVAMGWPALVIGHRGSGKSGIIKGLAAGVGARLTEVAMTPSVDVTELLGCFEQTDARAVQESLVETLEELADRTCRLLLEVSGDILPEAAVTAGAVWDALHAVRRSYRNAMAPGLDGGPQGNILGFTSQGMGAVDHLFLLLKAAKERIRADPNMTGTETARMSETNSLERWVERAVALATTVRQQAATDAAISATSDGSADGSGGGARGRKSSSASCFCWSDGVLVQALERGDWVVLDGANLCSSSVLDRLNPLLEPGGVLPLTECGTSSGNGQEGANGASSTSHRTIRPHPNFRLFLTADPSCGEVSRAMRNRCVEVSLVDALPAVAVVPAQPATADVGAGADEDALPAKAVTEHAADFLSMVRAAGMTEPREATAAIAVHSALVARRCTGSGNDSAGSGPSPRALLLWAELVAASRCRRVTSEGDDDYVDAWLRCLPLAYPRSSPGGGSSAEMKLARTVVSVCMAGPLASGSEESFSSADVIDSVVPCGWRETVKDSVVRQVLQDVKLVEIVLAASSTEASAGGDRCLLPLVVDAVGGGQSPPFTDLRLEPDDAALLLTAGEAASTSSVSRTLLAHAAVLVARKASSADRHLRVISSHRVTGSTARGSSGFGRGALAGSVGEAVSAMMAALFDSRARCEVSAMLAEMESEADVGGGGSGAQGNKTSSLRQAAALAGNRWSPSDPRENPDLFGSLRRLFHGSRTWGPCMLLLGIVDVFLVRRLPLVLAERAEVSEAQSRVSSGRGGEAGLGWLGLSWLICEGGRDASMVGGGGRGGASSTDTRLARYSLGPYLWPLLRAIDVLVERLACREVAELATSGQDGQEFPNRLLGGVRSVMEARDTLSGLLVVASASKDEGACADAASTRGPRGELLFAWDPFLVSWRWLQQGLEALRTTLGASPTVISLANVSSAFATLDAVGARVNAAVLQHAGGAAPTRDTLWKHGPRAAAPSSAAGAIALARLGRLADEFRILPSTCSVSADSGVVSLGSLMRKAHPSLSVSRDMRGELLHALCTLQWVFSKEQVEDGTGVSSHPVALPNNEGDGGGVSLAARLPELLEDTLKSSRARFEAAHKGTRLGGADRRDDGLEHHQDDLEFGERFDDFDTEATEAVANATLLVVAGDSGSAGRDEEVSHGGGGVMQDWAAVQLSPLMEHWIAVEECEILAALAGLDVAAALGGRENVVGVSSEPRLMARLSRLRSAILATPSLSPAAARPHQTLLWALDDSSSWPDVLAPLLKRLLPVAMASFGRRLWDNVVGAPEALSLQLAPPEMVDGGGEGHQDYTPTGSPDTWLAGPAQLLTLARSSFLLRLLSTAVFCGGVVPGGKRHVVDLTLMNASARLGQFRTAMRRVRDLTYGGGGGWGGEPGGALKPLVQLAWARFCRTLGAFDDVQATGVEAPATFAAALFAAGGESSVPLSTSWGTVEGPLRQALKSCPDQRLAAQTDLLVLPAARHLLVAKEELVGQRAEGPTARVEASAGLGMALLGCLKLVLLLPSSPVDPGLKPALKRELLGERLGGYRGELTVRRWSMRLEGGGDVSPEMLPLLQQARSLRDECTRLGLEAIERPDGRPTFHSLFRDVHAFARGLADPGRVTALAHSLARFVGGVAGLEEDWGAGKGKALDRAASLQEEMVWQDAAGAFVSRFRTEYGDAYADVVTGICDAVEVTRLGLRVLAAACSSAAYFSPTDATPLGKVAPRPLAKLQGTLLSFPYPCCEGLTRAGDGSGEGLGEALRSTLGSGADGGGGAGGGAFGAQHMMLLQAVLSRAELLLSSECSAQPAVDAAVSAMEGAVDAWSRVEAEEAEKRRKEAEILKYKMQEHVVESEEAINLAKLRALFPDYHSGFKDIMAENAPADSGEQDEAADGAGTSEGALDARAKALGHMSDKHLSSLVARHCRIFLSLSARRRRLLRGLFASRGGTSPETAGFVGGRSCSDAERLVAFRDSYRSSVLLAAPTSKLSSCVVLASPTLADAACPVLHMEGAFAGSHLLALADAARLCKTGRSLLEDAAAGGEPTASKKASKKGRGDGVVGVGVAGWLGEGAVRRNLLLVDPLVNFHLDGNVAETRLADGPLASVLRRVAGLLEDFPGHGVLIQLARVADRVRRMPLHSPLAAVLAGVELTLRKAQDWEQHAHRGVSLKDELRSLSSLVVRWRAIELKSWPQLLDAREGAFVLKANRWWLHLHRLLTGEWNKDLQASNPLQLQRDPAAAPGGVPVSDGPAAVQQVPGGKVFKAPDWPSASGYFPDWLWSGLVSKKGAGVAEESSGGLDAASLDHARGLFQPLDDFLRTSNIGEFFARLQMLRAFAAQLCSSSNGATTAFRDDPNDSKTCTRRAQALGIVVQGLWQYYSQFSEEVENARSLVRKSIEKKLKEEAKLAKWDEQTYYSLAESSEKSHRKLSKLVSQYDEVLEVSVSEVLHRTLIAGIGERQEGNNPNPMAPCTEIPTLGSMFSVVKKVDTAVDFLDDDKEEERSDLDGSLKQQQEQRPEGGVDGKTHPAPAKPSKPKRLTSKTTPAAGNSLELLDACLPVAPPNHTASMPGLAAGDTGETPVWLKEALFSTGSSDATAETGVVSSTAAAGPPLVARLAPLAQRMRSLLLRGVYARGRTGSGWGWADGGRPAGFVGAGLAEELCLAVFARIQGLRAKGVGKQVKKRAVLDLLGGMRKQGLSHAKSNTPPQTSDMLHVMALAQPFCEDGLAGFDVAWLFSGEGGTRKAEVNGTDEVAADLLRRSERYYLRGVSEVSRLRLEAGAPVSSDMTRREAEVMRGLAENLGLLVLQQRGAATALESDLLSFLQEVRAIQSLTTDYGISAASAAEASPRTTAGEPSAIPPQSTLRLALETQRRGLLRGLEAVREVQLLHTAMAGADPPVASTSSPESRLRTARGGEGWGEAATDAATYAEVKTAIDSLERSLSGMLCAVQRYPPPSTIHGAALEVGDDAEQAATPLLAARAARLVVENREALRARSADAREISDRFAGVLPRAMLVRVATHLCDVDVSVGSALDGNSAMRSWLLADAVAVADDSTAADGCCKETEGYGDSREAAAKHATEVGERLTAAVKAMLLSVQSLCPRAEKGPADGTGSPSPVAATDGGNADGQDEEEEDAWSTGTTLFEAHASAFEQARGLKLWRCASAMASARLALRDFAEDEAVLGASARDAAAALVALCREVLVLAEQVLSAGKAVLIGMVALNKGTAKLHYVTVRVFRTLLSKGLCSDESEKGEGEGDGDIDGMKFDDDVEGTGMGEGEGKKDVTDQIEDEEQLLGLKGDEEPDKDQAQEAKELGEDDQDKGMEMENDFEGEMFDVPKGDEKDQDDKADDGDEKEELDREMGDLGDDADVVDEKLWDEDDEDEDQEEGNDQGEEKFEAGSRLDGEKPEEDEIRTKEDGQDDGDKGDGKEDDEGKGDDTKEDKKGKEGEDGDGADGQDGKEGEDGDEGEGEAEGEGPVNDDLEDNYEDKPMGVEVRGEDEAMEVDEEGRDVEEKEEKDGNGKGDEEGDEDIPDDLNLDNAQEDGGDEEGKEGEGDDDDKGGDGEDEDEEGKEKEGFESLAPEKDGEEEEGEDLMEDEQQPQGSGNPGPADVEAMEEEKREEEGDDEKKEDGGDEEEDAAVEEETKRAEGAEEPPAFGVEGEGGDSSVLEAAKEEGDGRPTEDEKGEDEEQDKEEGQDGGGSAPDGRDDGGGGGQGEEGEGGEWRPDMSGGEGKGEGQGNDKRRRPDAPNPFRDPGDAMRHWHRRLDMLQDKGKEEAAQEGEGEGEKDLGDDTGDGEKEDGDGGEGKFEYVTSTERGSSQVLGGVSEEQAAEAAHEEQRKAQDERDGDDDEEGNVVEHPDGDGDNADANDGVEAMDQDHEQEVPRADGDDEGLDKDGSEVVDSSRKSGKRRDKDGHREDVEDGTDPQQEDGNEDEEPPVPDTENASLDLNSLEEPPPGAGDNANGAIVTNPLASRGHQEEEENGRQSSRGRETRLREELHALAEELQRVKRDRDGQEGREVSRELWGRLRSVTGALSQRLCEQLRLVLEPMVATKLQGDYRSGKRINMRRVIPYIASGFRKDKIWLRRTKPAKRDYQILMAIDDSESMADCGAGALALAAMTMVASGLTQLEAGQLAVARFGEDLDLLHGFGDPFTEEAGAKIVDGFTFDQKRTNTAHTLEGLVSLLEEARSGFSMSSGGVGSKGTPRQLVLLLSDGRFDRENKDRLRKLVREMNERGQLLVLIVLDKEGDTSILKTREATYVNGKLVLTSYLDKYPFPLYMLLNHIEALPETLADALRQWFELLQRQTSR